MSDPVTPVPVPTAEPAPVAPVAPDEAQLGDAGKAALKVERDARAEAERELATLRADKQAADDAKLSDIDKANKAASDKEAENAGLRNSIARLTALAAHPVPVEYQHLVTGSDAASFESSAKAISELAALAVGKVTPTVVHDSGTRTGDQTSTGGSVAAGAAAYHARKNK